MAHCTQTASLKRSGRSPQGWYDVRTGTSCEINSSSSVFYMTKNEYRSVMRNFLFARESAMAILCGVFLLALVFAARPAHAETSFPPGVPQGNADLFPGGITTPHVSQPTGYGGHTSPIIPPRIDTLLGTIPQKIVAQVNSIVGTVFRTLHLPWQR